MFFLLLNFYTFIQDLRKIMNKNYLHTISNFVSETGTAMIMIITRITPLG
ncbi:MAG: hypothetical protein WCE57_01410 [Salegentibacter sp.]